MQNFYNLTNCQLLLVIYEGCQKKEKNGNETKEYKMKFTNQVSLNGNKEALKVNWIEVERIDENSEKNPYHNAFVTDIKITKNNCFELAKLELLECFSIELN